MGLGLLMICLVFFLVLFVLFETDITLLVMCLMFYSLCRLLHLIACFEFLFYLIMCFCVFDLMHDYVFSCIFFWFYLSYSRLILLVFCSLCAYCSIRRVVYYNYLHVLNFSFSVLRKVFF